MPLTSLCWLCANAYGQCSWSRDFRAVKGWEAEKTIINNNNGKKENKIESYCVKSCPHFKKEGEKQ